MTSAAATSSSQATATAASLSTTTATTTVAQTQTGNTPAEKKALFGFLTPEIASYFVGEWIYARAITD